MATWTRIPYASSSKRNLNWDLTAASKYGAIYGDINVMLKNDHMIPSLGDYRPNYFSRIPFSIDGLTPLDNIDQDGADVNSVQNWHLQEASSGTDTSTATITLSAMGHLSDNNATTWDDAVLESMWNGVMMVPNSDRSSPYHIFNISGWMVNGSNHTWSATDDGIPYCHVQIWKANMPIPIMLGGDADGTYTDKLEFRLMKRCVSNSLNPSQTFLPPFFEQDLSSHFSAQEVGVPLDSGDCFAGKASYYLVTWFISSEADGGADATKCINWPDRLNAATSTDRVEMQLSVGVEYTPIQAGS